MYFTMICVPLFFKLLTAYVIMFITERFYKTI